MANIMIELLAVCEMVCCIGYIGDGSGGGIDGDGDRVRSVASQSCGQWKRCELATELVSIHSPICECFARVLSHVCDKPADKYERPTVRTAHTCTYSNRLRTHTHTHTGNALSTTSTQRQHRRMRRRFSVFVDVVVVVVRARNNNTPRWEFWKLSPRQTAHMRC